VPRIVKKAKVQLPQPKKSGGTAAEGKEKEMPQTTPPATEGTKPAPKVGKKNSYFKELYAKQK